MQSMHRQVLLLASAQALFQTVSVLVVTIGALAGSQIAPSPEWATAPIAAMFLGTALGTVPASMLMSRIGRKIGFITGAALGGLGGLIAAFGVSTGSLLLLCIGTLLVGTYQSFAQFYRFAAAEVASRAFRPRAISLVLAGGVVAAFAGPALARLGGDLLQPTYMASFLIVAVVCLLGVGVLLGVTIPQPMAEETGAEPARKLLTVITQPRYLVALFGALTGYGVMVLTMTATPLAMAHHHHGLGETASVIQFHVLGMFLPSFITGSLIARFGVLTIMLTGVVLFVGHILLVLSGTGYYSFVGALILVGIGWNFLYVGGTNLLTTTYSAAEKTKALATNDLTIFIVGLAASLGSGILHNGLGWQTLNLVLLPWLALAAAAIIWAGRLPAPDAAAATAPVSEQSAPSV